MICGLIDNQQKKIVDNNFAEQLITEVIYHVKMLNILWFQVLHCEDLQLLSVLHHYKLNLFSTPNYALDKTKQFKDSTLASWKL